MSATETSTQAPRRQRADARRNGERLLAAAQAAFAEHGTDASLDEIAKRAGVGIGTLYRHFPTRQALLEAVFRGKLDALCEEAETWTETRSAGDALDMWLRAQMRQARECRGLAAEVMITMLDENSDRPAPCEATREYTQVLLARAQGAGEIRADADADDVMRMVSGIVLATEDAPDGPAQADRLFAVMMDGLRTK
jgi:AcrR family transcriptional regulator